MRAEELHGLLTALARGEADVESVFDELRRGPFRTDRLPYAVPDHHRPLRQGMAEVVFGEGKDPEQIEEIVRRLAAGGEPVLVTRAAPAAAERLVECFAGARWNLRARCVTVPAAAAGAAGPAGPGDARPYVSILAAGTTDIPVAEEAAEVCRLHDVPVKCRYDVGVSGLHRLLEHVPEVAGAAAVVIVAGMEGALPSVVAGLVDRPVFAVPTSVGYGTSFGGVAALLAMLNSCAPGLAVFNIDNGFSAGVAASRVVMQVRRAAAEG